MEFPVSENEADRFAAVQSYNVYGSDPELGFDDLTELAAQIVAAPISLINIVGDTSNWIKARHGVPAELSEVPRGAVCCAHAICQSDLLVVPDTHADDRFKDLPFISTDPFVRFYAGMPLVDANGYALGTLCVMDVKPRELEFETAEALRRLARQVVAQLELRIRLAEVEQARHDLASAKERAESLILNILPAHIAQELSETGQVKPRHHTMATIMFTDFVGFTKSAEQLAPRTLVDDLHLYFSDFDEIVKHHGLEKLKTIGDAYMCAGGLLAEDKYHPINACLAALEIRDYMRQANERREQHRQVPWDLRIGIHTGSVMSGVVGKTKFTYDIWGDAVNVAARMESASDPGEINVSESIFRRAKDYFDFSQRGKLATKNKGEMTMHFLKGLKDQYQLDNNPSRPNDKLSNELSGTTLKWQLSS